METFLTELEVRLALDMNSVQEHGSGHRTEAWREYFPRELHGTRYTLTNRR